MHILIISLFLLFSFGNQSCYAAEVDSITPRNLQLTNSLTALNKIFNQRIQEGIEKANAKHENKNKREKGTFCDEEVLYTELRKAIFQSFTASWGFKGFDLDKQLRSLLVENSYSLSLSDSIYRDISYLEGLSLNIIELSDVVNINGHLIGLDKLGHFFAEGWKYFELTQYDDQSIVDALEWGKQQETGKFGYTTTGIFSFADLVANFNGWRFWNKILLKSNDPLKGVLANFFNRPYITCKRQIGVSIKNKQVIKAWQFNTRFDLSDYMDGTWDEGNNCNSYKSPIIEEKVAFRIKNTHLGFTFPLIIEHCLQSQGKYGFYAKYVLHPRCLTQQKKTL